MVPFTGPASTASTPFTTTAGIVVTAMVAVAVATGQERGHVCPAPEPHAATVNCASARIRTALMEPGTSLEVATQFISSRHCKFQTRDDLIFLKGTSLKVGNGKTGMSQSHRALSVQRPAVQQRTPRSRSSVSRPRGAAGAARGVAASADLRVDVCGVRLLQWLVSRRCCVMPI